MHGLEVDKENNIPVSITFDHAIIPIYSLNEKNTFNRERKTYSDIYYCVQFLNDMVI